MGTTRSVELLVDILNAFNDTAEEGVAARSSFSPNLGISTNFVTPRRAMMGVRLSF